MTPKELVLRNWDLKERKLPFPLLMGNKKMVIQLQRNKMTRRQGYITCAVGMKVLWSQ